MIKSPMLACSKQPDLTKLTYPLYASFKLDGIRCVTPEDQVLSRKLKPIPNKYIQSQLSGMPVGFDGELMVKGSFNDVDSAVMSFEGEPNFTYEVFDLCDQPTNSTFETRQKELRIVIDELGSWLPHVKLVHQQLCHGPSDVQDYYNLALSKGYEGLILRDPKGLYKESRSTLKQQWMLKVKPSEDTEAVIFDKTELMHNENEAVINNVGGQERSKEQEGLRGGNTLGALLCRDKDGRIVKVGSGFTAAHRQDLWDNFDNYIGKTITFKYQDLTPDGAYRFPVFKGFRSD